MHFLNFVLVRFVNFWVLFMWEESTCKSLHLQSYLKSRLKIIFLHNKILKDKMFQFTVAHLSFGLNALTAQRAYDSSSEQAISLIYSLSWLFVVVCERHCLTLTIYEVITVLFWTKIMFVVKFWNAWEEKVKLFCLVVLNVCFVLFFISGWMTTFLKQ